MVEKKEIQYVGNKEYKVRGETVQFPEVLYHNLMTLKEFVARKFDCVEINDGMEGSGKTELSFQMALILNEKFSEDDVVYTVEQFDEWLSQAKKGDVCVWDEFVLAGLSTDALSEIQNTLIKKMTIMRSKGVYLLMNVPYIFMLRKYFAVARTRFFIHTYTQGFYRGFMKFYTYESKKYIYNYGAKTWIYSPKVHPAFHARFGNWSEKFLDLDKIEVKKQAALKSLDEHKKLLKLSKRETEVLSDMDNPFDQRDAPNQYKVFYTLKTKCIKKYAILSRE